MNSKPNILVISNSKNHLESYKFTLLKKDYNFKSIIINLNNDCKQEVNKIINSLTYKPDGIISLTDETSLVSSLIAEKLNLNSPIPQSIAQIQHKGNFFTKLKNKNYILPSTVVDANDYHIHKNKIKYPIFIRPVRGTLSQHSNKISSVAEFDNFISSKGKLPFSKLQKSFFNNQLKMSLQQYIFQPCVNFKQYTLDGMILNNKTKIIGITKSIFDDKGHSFIRFDFPVNFNKNIKSKLENLIKDLTETFGYDNGMFNIEFFLDGYTNKVYLIEFNTRHSREFECLYNSRYTHSITDMTTQVSLNKKPNLSIRKDNVIAKSFILRKYKDFVITKLPNEKELDIIKQKYNLEKIKIDQKINQKLSNKKQDSYSYRYGVIDIHGTTDKEIFSKYEKVKKELNKLITFSPVSD